MEEKFMKLSDRPVVIEFAEKPKQSNQQADDAIARIFVDYMKRINQEVEICSEG